VNNDITAPYVTGVTGVIDNTVAVAMLEDDVRKTFVVNFSEAMNIEVDTDVTSSVIVKSGLTRGTMVNTDVTATIGANGKSIIITATSDITDNTLIDINLLVTDFKDTAGNFLKVSVPADAMDIAYDSKGVNTNSAQVVALQLQSFNDLNTNATSPTDIAMMTKDNSNVSDDITVTQNATNALIVTLDTGDTAITQLNDNNGDTTDNLAAIRLGALATALNSNTAATVVTNVARINFTPTGAASYNVQVERSATNTGLVNVTALGAGNTISTNVTVNTDFTGVAGSVANISVPTGDINSIELLLNGVTTGNVVKITPLDDLGYAGTPAIYTLKDNVKPTTILQKSYDFVADNALAYSNLYGASNGVTSDSDGGQLSVVGTTAVAGTPYLYITPALIDNSTISGAGVVTTTGNQKFDEISRYNTTNATATTTDKRYITRDGLYDASAWTLFNTDANLARTIGIAFSEDVTLSANPAYDGATLSNYVVNNDAVDANDAQGTSTDLVNADVSNVLTLANNEALKVIDFTSVISDNAGNIADANTAAKVVIGDAMPPFVTSAKYDTTGVVIVFNEAIVITTTANPSITVSNEAGTVNHVAILNDANDYTLSTDGKTLTVLAAAFAASTTPVLSSFDIGTAATTAKTPYTESAYSASVNHAILSWDNIKDTFGNSWANAYQADTTTANTYIVPPKFAIADLIGDFTDTPNANGFKVGTVAAPVNSSTTAQVVTWTFTHPVRVDGAGDLFASANAAADGTITLNAAATVLLFQTNDLAADGGPDAVTNLDAANPTKTVLSADRKSISLTFTTEADTTVTTDYVRLMAGNTITSATDITQNITGINLSANARN
jgi:hypothetical protein